MVSAVTGVTHSQPVTPVQAVHTKPHQTKPQQTTQGDDTVELSSTAQAHLSALKASRQEAGGTRARSEKQAAIHHVQAQKLLDKQTATATKK